MNTPFSTSPDLAAYDGRSVVLNIVSFLLPPLGLVLYLALMIARLPQKAVSVGRSATFGLGFYIGVVIFASITAGIYRIIYLQQNPEPAVPVMSVKPPADIRIPNP